MLEFLDRILNAETADDVWALQTDAIESFGFDRLIYGFTRYMTETGFGCPDDCLILSNHEPEYVQRYIGDGLYAHAPMLHWAARNVGACSWRWVRENLHAFGDAQHEVLALNRQYGVTAGYTISFHDATSRSKGALGLAARPGLTQDDADAIWSRHGRTITAMCGVAHLKMIQLPFGSARKLTRRQRETLEWVRDGKTAQETAAIMGVSAATVEKHLRLAREALNAGTTTQAVLKATMQNQIFVLEA
ncbi:MAG: helix-turn-helix transcriptional regulator [Tranquillimonas sp.]|jgi:LuxR family transcriptional regulator